MYSHWLDPESEPRQGLGLGRMGCMVLIRTFHAAPEQGQGRTREHFQGMKNGSATHFSGPENICSDEY